MLLKHLYDFAVSRNLLADPAFAPKAVRWIIDLDDNGNLLGTGAIDTATDGKRGKEYSCPQTSRSKNAGGIAEFLAEGITAVFGFDTDPEPKKKRGDKQEEDRQRNNAAKTAEFWQQITDATEQTQHAGLLSLAEFRKKLIVDEHQRTVSYPLENADDKLVLLRFGKDAKRPDASSAWWLHSAATGTEVKLSTDNFTFRVDGKLLLEDAMLRQWWRKTHTAEIQQTKDSAERGLCIITGKPEQPIAKTHGKIMSVPGGSAFGASLVSFDKPAFSSYGFDQSLNCPTSEDAATAYCAALNYLIEKDDGHLRIGPTLLCFWVVKKSSAGGTFSRLLNQPDPQAVTTFMKSPWAGIERDLAKQDSFIAITLGGNSGRVVVRHWLQETLEQAVENFTQWFADLDIAAPQRPAPSAARKTADKKNEYNPLSVYWLANTTVREAKDLPSDVLSQLYRAALENFSPSVSLITPILNQLHSRLLRDDKYKLIYDQSRFALLKLILNRNRKENEMEIKPELTDTNDPAYNCGRLLSVLAETQKKAHDYKLEGAGVVERYFATAGVSPSSVFPLLLRLNRHHLNKIRKSEKWSGGERFLEEQIRTIAAKFKSCGEGCPPVFPRILDLQAQGRFALGFYQQQAADALARDIARDIACVLFYLKETNPTAYDEVVELREKDPAAFSERMNPLIGVAREWAKKNRN
ncbi:hypothetical protein AGMMS49959_17060 [Planctomycetales bacterium]|nr:hypothetical protein AGMMS49959_17060 [Planctomycetales bacterium]